MFRLNRTVGTRRDTRTIEGGGTPWFGLASALSFSLSAMVIRLGVDTGTPPIVGLWIGFASAWVLFVPAGYIAARRNGDARNPVSPRLIYQVLAAVFITIGMWLRYVATRTVPIAVVTALARLNIPFILLVSPLFLKTRLDATSTRLWIGAILIVGGATLMVFAP